MRALLATLLLATTCGIAMGDENLLGKTVTTGSSGAPFCTDKDQLQEYMLAALQNDTKWLKSLGSCAFVKGGLKVAVIEDLPGSDLGHVIKARVFGPGGSLVAYTLSMGLEVK